MQLSEVMKRGVAQAMRQTRVAMPAVVVSYDGGSGLASVRVLIPDVSPGGETAEQPVIPAVPVSFPRGGGASVTWPLGAGDTGIVIFADRDIGGWAVDGDTSPPESDRMHSLTDGMFIPGLGGGSTGDLVLRMGSTTVTLTNDGVDIVGNVTVKGDVAIDGGLTTTGTTQSQGSISTDGDVVAGSISLTGHSHPGDSGGTTGIPE